MPNFTCPRTAHTKGNVSALTVTATAVGSLGILSGNFDAGSPEIAPANGGTWARIGSKQHDAGHNQDQTWFWILFKSSITSIDLGGLIAAAGITFAEFVCDLGFAASPLDTEDSTQALYSSTTTPDAEASGSIKVAEADELLVSTISDHSGTAPTFTAGAGFTLAVTEPGNAGATGASAIEWRKSVAGAQVATWTMDKTGDAGYPQVAAFSALQTDRPAPHRMSLGV